MSLDPKNFKKDDDRSFQQIASDILDSRIVKVERLFREPYSFCIHSNLDELSEDLGEIGVDLNLWFDTLKLSFALERIGTLADTERRSALDFAKEHTNEIRKSLLVLGGLIKRQQADIDDRLNEARLGDDLVRDLFLQVIEEKAPGKSDEEMRREADDLMRSIGSADYYTELNLMKELQSLEKDFRALASKLGITLIEPEGPDGLGGGRSGGGRGG
jgi:hypothetical protein